MVSHHKLVAIRPLPEDTQRCTSIVTKQRVSCAPEYGDWAAQPVGGAPTAQERRRSIEEGSLRKLMRRQATCMCRSVSRCRQQRRPHPHRVTNPISHKLYATHPCRHLCRHSAVAKTPDLFDLMGDLSTFMRYSEMIACGISPDMAACDGDGAGGSRHIQPNPADATGRQAPAWTGQMHPATMHVNAYVPAQSDRVSSAVVKAPSIAPVARPAGPMARHQQPHQTYVQHTLRKPCAITDR